MKKFVLPLIITVSIVILAPIIYIIFLLLSIGGYNPVGDFIDKPVYEKESNNLEQIAQQLGYNETNRLGNFHDVNSMYGGDFTRIIFTTKDSKEVFEKKVESLNLSPDPVYGNDQNRNSEFSRLTLNSANYNDGHLDYNTVAPMEQVFPISNRSPYVEYWLSIPKERNNNKGISIYYASLPIAEAYWDNNGEKITDHVVVVELNR